MSRPRSFFTLTPPQPPAPTAEDLADEADFDREVDAMYRLISDTIFAYWDANPEQWRMDATLAALDTALRFFEETDREMDAELEAEEADA